MEEGSIRTSESEDTTIKVQIKGEIQDVAINTVSLVPDLTDNNLYMFHCTGCGASIAQYQGRVTKIYPFIEPTTDVMVVKRCRKCGMSYTFQTHHGYKNRTTKVILHANIDGYTAFYCHLGRQPVLRFNHDRIYSLADHQEKQVPFLGRCPVETCPAEYYFADLL